MDQPGPHGHPSLLPLVRPVAIERNDSGKSLSDLLEEGGIDATIGPTVPNAIRHNPDVVRLFPNYREAEPDYYRRTRIFPIRHLIALRRELYERHPSLASSLFDAMCQAKENARARMRDLGTLQFMLPWMTADLDEIDDVFDGDAWPRTVDLLRELDAVHVGVDAPQVGEATAPPLFAVTSPRLAVVRLHGRNRGTWYLRDAASSRDRFDYLYRPDELREWVPAIRAAAAQGVPVQVVMNNNRSNYAIVNAFDLAAILGITLPPPPPAVLETLRERDGRLPEWAGPAADDAGAPLGQLDLGV